MNGRPKIALAQHVFTSLRFIYVPGLRIGGVRTQARRRASPSPLERFAGTSAWSDTRGNRHGWSSIADQRGRGSASKPACPLPPPDAPPKYPRRSPDRAARSGRRSLLRGLRTRLQAVEPNILDKAQRRKRRKRARARVLRLGLACPGQADFWRAADGNSAPK